MSGRAGNGTDASASALVGAPRLNEAWDRFRAGEMVFCPRDGGPLALAVDASAVAYRFVCTDCGAASPWFESGAAGLKVRAGSVPLIPGSSVVDE